MTGTVTKQFICPSIFSYSKCIKFINDPKNVALYTKWNVSMHLSLYVQCRVPHK
jgi:hypothetical protein